METLEQKLIRKRERHNEQSKLRMRKYRANNNLSVEKSVQFKKKDAERQKRKRVLQRSTDSEEMKIVKRAKERERKRKQRARKKCAQEEGHSVEINTIASMEQQIEDLQRAKKAEQKQKTRLLKRKGEEIDALSRMLMKKAKKNSAESSFVQEEKTPQKENESGKPGAAKAIWSCLTPNTRRSTAIKLKSLSPGSRPAAAIRKEIGLNLSYRHIPGNENGSLLCQEVKAFFDRDDVSSLCPDKNKVVKNPLDEDEAPTQVRYRNSNIRSLLAKFNAERQGPSCSERIFQKYIPYYVKKANPLEWGTCMCEYCLNPELKFDSLKKLKLFNGSDFEEKTKEENIEKFREEMANLKPPEKN